MTVVTRFAPSPTGYLHIGSARTALFNWLFARHEGGKFRLRIEDTDRVRSTEQAKAAIVDGLKWLGLTWDDEIVYQSARATRHAALARVLLENGKAYRCYCTPEELAEMRARSKAAGHSMLYDGRWRDRAPADAPSGVDPVIRIKMPLEGETVIEDHVQGTVRVDNKQLDDMVLLRADGTPTYMLSVVVDDHDMGVSHVIRGDDHLTNAFRQYQLYRAFDWPAPAFAHIPLIHGPDGNKLSKRHGALGVDSYRDTGYLPETLRNYLLRLGWSHRDDEIISTDQAIEWFGLDNIGRSAARFDPARLDSLNKHYIQQCDDARLVALILPQLARRLGYDPAETARERLATGMPGLKSRANTITELAENAEFYIALRPLKLDNKAEKLLGQQGRQRLAHLSEALRLVDTWAAVAIESATREFADRSGVKLRDVAQPLRAALTGRAESPGIFEVMETLGRTESLARIGDILPTELR